MIEIIIAVAILVLILGLAYPSFEGVIADRKLRASLDRFNNIVRVAQEHSVNEHRAYLVVWSNKEVVVQPEAFSRDEERKAAARFPLDYGEILTLSLPAAISKTAGEWIFWPTGTCEPASVHYEGHAGVWTADYSPLTGHGQLSQYAAK